MKPERPQATYSVVAGKSATRRAHPVFHQRKHSFVLDSSNRTMTYSLVKSSSGNRYSGCIPSITERANLSSEVFAYKLPGRASPSATILKIRLTLSRAPWFWGDPTRARNGIPGCLCCLWRYTLSSGVCCQT